MIVFDNIIFSILKSGGISVVWKELLDRIIDNEDFHYLCMEYNHAEENIFRKQLNIPILHLKRINYPFFNIQRYINPIIKSDDSFIFHSSYYRICKNKKAINITTVHDFTYEHFSKGLRKLVHCHQKHQAIRNSDYIICISENTKKDLLTFLPDIPETKIEVIYNGVSDDYFLISKLDNSSLPFERNSYIIFVGARGWYKRFDFAIEVVVKTNLNLVIVGNELTSEEIKILNKKLANRYKYLGKISNQELNIAYNGAFCLLYPSEYEGFGIPILESQKAGCPSIAFNSSSIPEIIGESSLLFNSFNTDDVLKIIDKLRDNSYRNYIIEKGIINANKYSWGKMYNQIINLYKKAYRKCES
jgi:mannosyltransferase